MIYNLHKYLENQFPAETLFVNITSKIYPNAIIPDRCVLLKEISGTEGAYYRFKEKSVQIITQDIDDVKSRKLAYDVYGKLHGIFGLELPTVTVGGVVYPAIDIPEAKGAVLPQSIGMDEEGRVQYSTTYIFYYV